MYLKPVADMTADEAAFQLRDFLAQGAATASELVARAIAAGVDADYSVASVPAVMRWAAADVRLVLLDPDPNLPDWINPASHDWRDLDPASPPPFSPSPTTWESPRPGPPGPPALDHRQPRVRPRQPTRRRRIRPRPATISGRGDVKPLPTHHQTP